MITRIMCIALIVVPYITIIGQDIRELKFQLAIGFGLGLTLLHLSKNKLEPVNNKPALAFLFYLWIATMLAPWPGITLAGMNIGYFWAWKPLYTITIMFFFMCSISSWKLEKKDVDLMLKVMVWAGAIMGAYVLLQGLYLDQFFELNEKSMPHEQWRLAGTIGHPSFVATWMAMIVPIALYKKMKWQATVIILAVLMTLSMTGIGAMCAGLFFWFASKGRKQLLFTIIILISLCGITTYAYKSYPQVREHVTGSGRFYQWPIVAKDINSSLCKEEQAKFPLTGRGMGSFYYVYHTEHKNRFYQAHNEYLELAYNVGILGVGLFVLAILRMFGLNIKRLPGNEYRQALLASFFSIATAAGALFVWQLGAHVFYTVFIVGLLHAKGPEEEEYATR